MAKILITGATGFVGKSLVSVLIDAGHSVRCAVTKEVEWFKTDQVIINRLEEQNDWSEALDGIEVVIHLAARVHIMKEKSPDALDKYCEVNSIATKKLAEQAAQHKVKRFIFLSSIKVNGESTVEGSPFTEESIPQPEDAYGKSKLLAEQYLHAVSQNKGMEIVILRPPLIYGAGVKANFLKMIKLVDKGFPLPFGKVQNKRSFIYIGNLVSAICAVIEAPEAANQLYLVADDDALSLPSLIRGLHEEIDSKRKLIALPVCFLTFIFRLFGFTSLNTRLLGSLVVNNNKIKKQLGWTFPYDSMSGLKKTAKWYKKNKSFI
jgi:nucleoside-diphosphate-sugar epimerase